MGLQLVVPLGRSAPAACSIFLSFVGPFLDQIPSLFFLQVQKVHKSLLEGCQPFRELRKVLFLSYFYLLFKRKDTLSPRELGDFQSAFKLWSEVTVLALSTGRCPEDGEQRGTLITSPATKAEDTWKDVSPHHLLHDKVYRLGQSEGKVKMQPEHLRDEERRGWEQARRREAKSDRRGRNYFQGQGSLFHLHLLGSMKWDQVCKHP